MGGEETGRTAGEWFEEGRQCFHQPDGEGAVNALEHVIDMDPAYRHPDGDNPYFYLGKINEWRTVCKLLLVITPVRWQSTPWMKRA